MAGLGQVRMVVDMIMAMVAAFIVHVTCCTMSHESEANSLTQVVVSRFRSSNSSTVCVPETDIRRGWQDPLIGRILVIVYTEE